MSRPSWADLPDVEKAAFADSIIAYCGRNEMRDDRIVHHVEQSLNPALVDSAQNRFARVDGDRLTVSDVPFDGTRARQQAVWERVTSR
jgi:hypothetical protein